MRGRPSSFLFLLVAVAFISPSAANGQTASPADPVTTASTAAPGAVAGPSKPLPSVEEVLQKYETAEGGREAWSHFTTRFTKGIYQTEDASFFAAIERSDKAPNQTFSKITMPNGVTVREVCNGKSAWIEDARGGIHDFVGAALESHLREARFDRGVNALLGIPLGKTVATGQVGAHSVYIVDFSPQKDIS